MSTTTRKVKHALKYTAKDWLEFGDVPNPTTREKMILLAIEQIREVGPVDFNALEVCQRLKIKAPMVNYYFGSRDGFLAETTFWVYRVWNKTVINAIREAPKNPSDRLSAWIDTEIKCAKHIGGMYVLLNYPMASGNTTQLLADKYTNAMRRLFEYLIAFVAVSIRDLERGTADDLNFDADSIPKSEFMLTPKYVLKAIEMAWALNGLALWHSGHHAPSQGLRSSPFGSLTVEVATNSMKESILRIADPVAN